MNDPPTFAERPMHCEESEILVQLMKAQSTGFSASNMQKWYYFANTTPPFSPPTVTMSQPTSVLTTTLKYLAPYLKERKLQDPLPSSWCIDIEANQSTRLVPVQKESLHLYDGDSLEILVTKDSPPMLKSLVTHSDDKIRVRLLSSDSPETEDSVRIYKQDEHSTNMTTFLTRHPGIEALRAARQLVFTAKKIYLQIQAYDVQGRISVELDQYNRRLLNVILEDQNGRQTNLATLLASKGFTFSFYSCKVDNEIHQAMRQAIADKRGLFNMPEEVFTHPYRPWDLRRARRTNNRSVYDNYQPILNKPPDPAAAWAARVDGISCPDEEDRSESQPTDSFYFRVVKCKLHWESKCFKSQSSIPEAGNGLFLKPQDGIPRGSHLCLYSDSPTTAEAIQASGSSKVYALSTGRKNIWFDAEMENGNNLGRFANQPGVLEAFFKIKQLSMKPKPQMTEGDWQNIEKQLDAKCNGEFAVSGNQLVIRAKVDLVKKRSPTEVFVNYGGLRDYWIPLVKQPTTANPSLVKMSQIVQWLQDSPDCNWSVEQRKAWLN